MKPGSKTRLDGQVAIVTGGARGIGLGIARRLAEAGARIVVWDADVSPLETVKDFKAAATVKIDLTDPAAVEASFKAAVSQFGQVHIVVNNAGINGPIHPAWAYPLEAWDRVMAVNLTAVFYVSRLAAEHMRGKKYGRIVQIASIAGKEGVPNLGAYSAAKGGVIALAKSMAKEVCMDGVTVNCIAPAMTETPLFEQMTEEHIRNMKAKIPMGRFIQIDEIAELAVWIASPACSATTGFVFDVTGGRATY